MLDPTLLTSTRYDAEGVATQLDGRFGRRPFTLLTAVRLDDEERFWSLIRQICHDVDWADCTAWSPYRTPQPPPLLRHGAHYWDLLSGHLHECPIPGFSTVDLGWIDLLVDRPTADAAYAFLRMAAGMEDHGFDAWLASERLGDAGPFALHFRSGPSVQRRIMRVLGRHLGPVEDVLRSAAHNQVAPGTLQALAVWAADERDLSLDHVVVHGSFPGPAALRAYLQVCGELDVLADVLPGVAKARHDRDSPAVFDVVPWEEALEVASEVTFSRFLRFGTVVMTQAGKYKRVGTGMTEHHACASRVAARRHKTLAAAQKDLEKRIAKEEQKLGTARRPIRHGAGTSDTSVALFELEGHDEVWVGWMQELLTAGADANAVNADGVPLISLCANNPNKLRMLLAAGATPTDEALRVAAREGDIVNVERLLDAGASDVDGALVEACANGRASVATLLMARGASIQTREKRFANKTCFEIAADWPRTHAAVRA